MTARKGSDVDDSWLAASPLQCCHDGIKKHTHTLSVQRAHEHSNTHRHTHDSEHQITQRDVPSHSPGDNDDTSVHFNPSTQGAHINTLYTHAEVTENTL